MCKNGKNTPPPIFSIHFLGGGIKSNYLLKFSKLFCGFNYLM